MEIAYQISRALSILAFLGYGALIVGTDAMVDDFARFGLSRFRTLVGWLEVLGALGLLAGLWIHWATLPAAVGLTLLMVLGVATRLRVGDSLLATSPAFVLLVLNLFIAVHAWRAYGDSRPRSLDGARAAVSERATRESRVTIPSAERDGYST